MKLEPGTVALQNELESGKTAGAAPSRNWFERNKLDSAIRRTAKKLDFRSILCGSEYSLRLEFLVYWNFLFFPCSS